MSRCQGSRFCGKASETACVDCTRRLCRDHWTWTACGERGTHRHRSSDEHARERVRVCPKGDGHTMPPVFREVRRRTDGRRGPAKDMAKRGKVRELILAGLSNREIKESTGASRTMISQERVAVGKPGRGTRSILSDAQIAEVSAIVLADPKVNRAELGARYGVSRQCIARIMKGLGLTGPKRVVPEWKLDVIRREWPKGTRGADIGAMIGCDDSRVSELAQRLGLPGRATGRPRKSAA